MPSVRGCESGVAKTLKGTYTQTHSAGPCRGGSDRIPIHVCGEGGSGKKQGEKEWWEGDRREKDNGEKWGERKGWEDDIRGRDEVQRGEEGVGRGGRWK